jgi:hypothetical protein
MNLPDSSAIDSSTPVAQVAEAALGLVAITDSLNKEIERLKVLIRAGTSGKITNIDTPNGSVSVVRPDPSWTLRDGKTYKDVQRELGDKSSMFFATHIQIAPHRDLASRLTAIDDVYLKNTVLDLVDHNSATPRVGFKSFKPTEEV